MPRVKLNKELNWIELNFKHHNTDRLRVLKTLLTRPVVSFTAGSGDVLRNGSSSGRCRSAETWKPPPSSSSPPPSSCPSWPGAPTCRAPTPPAGTPAAATGSSTGSRLLPTPGLTRCSGHGQSWAVFLHFFNDKKWHFLPFLSSQFDSGGGLFR